MAKTRLTKQMRADIIEKVIARTSIIAEGKACLEKLGDIARRTYMARIEEQRPGWYKALDKCPQVIKDCLPTQGHINPHNLGSELKILHRLSFGRENVSRVEFKAVFHPPYTNPNYLTLPEEATELLKDVIAKYEDILNAVTAAVNAFNTLDDLLRDYPERDFIEKPQKTSLPAVIPTQVKDFLTAHGFDTVKKEEQQAKKRKKAA